MKKFEYKVIQLTSTATFDAKKKLAAYEALLNEWGVEGFELVSYEFLTSTAILKREIKS